MEGPRRTNDRSDLALRRGAGFPIASRDLAVPKPNRNDPNGYYAYLDLPTTASIAEIKKRCRFLLKMHHPDGTYPRRDLFERVEEIYTTLTNPVKKATYDHTPEGSLYVDTVVLAELKGRAGMSGSDLEKLLEEATPKRWSYYRACEPAEDDDEFVAEWYECLLQRAWEVGCRSRVVVVLYEGPFSKYVGGGEFWVAKYQPPSPRIVEKMIPSTQ